MKAAPFAYHRPGSVAEAVGLLEEVAADGGQGRVLAGGQSLLPLMAERRLSPSDLVDVVAIPGLDVVETTHSGVRIGAAVRQRDVEIDRVATGTVPLLGLVLPLVGRVSTRNRGTVLGSLMHADPAAELPTVLTALQGSVEIAGAAGQRTVGVRHLWDGAGRTALGAAEVALAASFPAPLGARCAWRELGRRPGDLPLVGVAVVAQIDERGLLTSLNIACGGVHDRPWLVEEGVLRQFLGAPMPSPDRIVAAAVGETVANLADPVTDRRTSADHRRMLVRTLVRRAMLDVALRQGEERCG